jgi:hypothetical protein
VSIEVMKHVKKVKCGSSNGREILGHDNWKRLQMKNQMGKICNTGDSNDDCSNCTYLSMNTISLLNIASIQASQYMDYCKSNVLHKLFTCLIFYFSNSLT